MKRNTILARSVLCLSLAVTGFGATSCGQLEELVAQQKEDSQNFASDTDTANLIDSAFTAASGSGEPSLKRFPLDSPETEDALGHGPRHGRGHGHGKRGGGRHGHAGPAIQIPDDIKALMTQADAKRDSILGIDRVKVDEIVQAMRTDLEALRSVSATREEFEAQAKVIVDKYSAELRTVLPAFDTLTQEQKDQVKAIHDLQRGMLTACIARGADPASESCTAAKAALQSNVTSE
jgi:Spy/CpxP family protein refolding chaperone